VAIIAGSTIQFDRLKLPLQHWRFRSAAVCVTSIAIAAYGAALADTASDTIAAMLNTVYPGHRVSVSGELHLAQLASGFFEPFRIGENTYPLPSANASEASSFVWLAPLVLLALPFRSLFRRESALLLTLGCFLLMAVSWIAIPLPPWPEHVLQAVGWSLVTSKRAVMALGVGSILACIVLFARVREGVEPLRSVLARRVAVASVGVVVFALGSWLRHQDPTFFTWKVLALGTLGSCLLAAGLLLGRMRLLVTGVAVYAMCTIAVNPLARGLSPLLEKPVLLAAKRAGAAAGDRWMVIGDANFAQGLKALGLSVFAGSQFLPDRPGISVLDPDGSYADIWNRLATIDVRSAPARSRAAFKLERGDRYAIFLNVCGPLPPALGITHVAYTVRVPKRDRTCLQPLPAPRNSGVQLFALKR
jgi:hypothetical protein